MKNLLNFIKKLFAPGFEATKAEILGKIDWAIQAIPGVGVPRVVATLKNGVQQLLGRAHLPGAASVLIQLAFAQVNWEGLLTAPADVAVEELTKLRKKVAGARL